MKAIELRKMAKAELEARVKSEQLRLEDLREKLTGKKLKNVRAIRSARKGIAMILTILNERPQ